MILRYSHGYLSSCVKHRAQRHIPMFTISISSAMHNRWPFKQNLTRFSHPRQQEDSLGIFPERTPKGKCSFKASASLKVIPGHVVEFGSWAALVWSCSIIDLDGNNGHLKARFTGQLDFSAHAIGRTRHMTSALMRRHIYSTEQLGYRCANAYRHTSFDWKGQGRQD